MFMVFWYHNSPSFLRKYVVFVYLRIIFILSSTQFSHFFLQIALLKMKIFQSNFESIHCIKCRFRYILWSSFQNLWRKLSFKFQGLSGWDVFFLGKIHNPLTLCVCYIFTFEAHTIQYISWHNREWKRWKVLLFIYWMS